MVKSLFVLLGMLLAGSTLAQGQALPSGSEGGGDAALVYNLVHTNTQPGKCGCFDATGASLSASLRLTSRIAGVANAGLLFAGNGPGTGNTLTLGSVVAGVRYYAPMYSLGVRVQPFAELLVGAAHAGGGIAGAGDHSTALAGQLGGGADLPLSGRLGLRVQADYFPTSFANAANNRQNNVSVGAGVVWHWSRL